MLYYFHNSGDAGIDLAYQLASYCTPMRKSIRWYHKVATEIILNTFFLNAQIMYNHQSFRTKLTINQFREALVDELLKLKPTSRMVPNFTAIEQPSNDRIQRRQTIKHKLEETEERCQQNRKIRCTEYYKRLSNYLGYKYVQYLYF